MKKLLVGSILLSLSLTMGACDQGEEKHAETSKEETAVKPEKKTNERELNKKSESQQIQDEQKDLRAYATKVEEERKAKELAEQKAKDLKAAGQLERANSFLEAANKLKTIQK